MSHFHCTDCDATIEVPEDRTFEVCPVCHLDKACELRPIAPAEARVEEPPRSAEMFVSQIMYDPAQPENQRITTLEVDSLVAATVNAPVGHGAPIPSTPTWPFTQDEMNEAGILSSRIVEYAERRRRFLRRRHQSDGGVTSLLTRACLVLQKVNHGP